MTFMRVFPFATAVMELSAAVVYITQREYALAVAWFCYAVACVALGMVK